MHKTKYIKTVDAEIKVFMRAQRVREGESRAEMQFTKWTAEGAVGICWYLAERTGKP